MSTETATTPQALFRIAHSNPDGAALADGDIRLTWAELLVEVQTTARCLAALDIKAKDRIAIWAPNTSHWVIAALGAHYAGAALVPINTRYTGHEALDIMQRTGVTALFVADPFLGTDRLAKLRDAAGADGLPELTTIIQIPTSDSAALADGVIGWDERTERGAEVALRRIDMRGAQVRPSDVADILFTSGTTGRSKGVLSAHRQVVDVARAWAACGEVTADDRYLVINPFFHSFGYKAGIVACLLTGATIVPQAVFEVEETMRLIATEKITVLPGAPTIYQAILDHPERAKHDLSSLRFAVTGAAVVPVALVERMQNELSFDIVLTAFGMTEAVVVTMCRRDDPPALVAQTCGRATAGFEISIGEQDELLVRGPNLMLGYLDDPDATAAAVDGDGWLHTGDVGSIDDAGYLRITDRLKDMYISGGFNVYPAEIEQTLARLDGVADCAVIGVADARLGEIGAAFVVMRSGASLDADAVVAFCRERLANYKVPRDVTFVDALPRNAAGKVLKADLRKEFT
ncbi:MAG: HIP---CoA ligase [Pseudonocardiales bacterium]|jgi:acyl-CoA synthetase (AMP-forming)/AMP-acid ligase II|nr:HIP---CoA ligase [Pseudonocardiales bacterium]